MKIHKRWHLESTEVVTKDIVAYNMSYLGKLLARYFFPWCVPFIQQSDLPPSLLDMQYSLHSSMLTTFYTVSKIVEEVMTCSWIKSGLVFVLQIPCCEPPTVKFCDGPCTKILPCGHPCKRRCKDPCTDKCLELVQSVNKCPKGHSVRLPCHLVNKGMMARF